jgi:magnesium-transporting ATPase (P-type)
MGTVMDKKEIVPVSSWHALRSESVFEKLDANPQGLTDEEAEKRAKIHGKNRLPSQKLLTVWQLMLHQLLNPLIFILAIAAVAALLIGEYADTGFILLVIAINTALGTFQEYKAQKSASELQKLLQIKARVLRNGEPVIIDSEDLVPGDIVLLESGLKVPADLRLIETQNLTSDESFLTGESMAASKSIVELPEETAIGDMRNMAFAGATINSGRGKGLVVATGRSTQVGIIAGSVTESDTAKPPLVLRMEKFSMKIGLTVIVVSILIGILLRYQGYDFAAIFFFIVALTVSAIPEGLPVAVTVALSVASKRMSKRNVIVRKLMAVESLGSCTIIASDKTGTLTVNQQTARQLVLPCGQIFKFTGEGDGHFPFFH